MLTDKFIRPIPLGAQERLDEELALIARFKFEKVFLQVYEIVRLLRQREIPYIIRGSAGSSLVCFLLGISHIDPIVFRVELARFMNQGRADLPDIDIDVPYNRRAELYRAIEELWPRRVARISNTVTYGYKGAKRECERRGLDASKENIEKIKGTFKCHSLHCGGIVIFEDEEEVPRELLLKEDEGVLPQIRLNKDETEDAGFIKIDLLSNRGLALWNEATEGKKELLEYPMRDVATERIFSSGDTIGLTFGESRGMRRLFMELRPRFIEDVAVALALIRPAAAAEGRKAAFLERWKNGYEHFAEDPDAYTPILFDDDALVVIRELLGCSSSEADAWRKVFSKGKTAGRIDFYKKLARAGYSVDESRIIVDDLDQLRLYSFCKSHAISYAQLVWALAYEKAHNPKRFWVAALNHSHSEYRRWVYWREAKCAGLRLTRSEGPYRLSADGGRILGAGGSEQTLLVENDLADYKKLGYWLGEGFLKGCGGLSKVEQRTLDRWIGEGSEERWKFRGLIACGRVVKRESVVTLLTIGYDNGAYLDLVIPEKARNDLFKWVCVEGVGIMKRAGVCEVLKIRGVSLSDACA